MTREEAKEFAPILQAYAEGEVIECRTDPSVLKKKDTPNDWTEMKEIEYWNNAEYRIKPKSKYRPFKDVKECWQEMQKHQPFGWIKKESKMCNIINIEDGIITHNGVGNGWYKFKISFDDFKFADGTPFGIRTEE